MKQEVVVKFQFQAKHCGSGDHFSLFRMRFVGRHQRQGESGYMKEYSTGGAKQFEWPQISV